MLRRRIWKRQKKKKGTKNAINAAALDVINNNLSQNGGGEFVEKEGAYQMGTISLRRGYANWG